MVSRPVLSWFAPALCAAVLLGFFLDQCSCQTAPQTVVLGGVTGWTDTANINFTQWMDTVQFKAGDTLRFNNTDIQDHSVFPVSSQADYDACNRNNNTGWTVNPGGIYDLPFVDPTYRVWIIDPAYCLTGQKVMFTVLNADGTAVAPDTGADPPSLNAPPASDYIAPPSPPAPPLGLAGGPTPNSAGSNSQAKLDWVVIAILVISACFLAAKL